MDDTIVVKEPLTPVQPSEGMGTEAKEEALVSAQAGDKTDPNLLLKSLQEEREKRRVLEEKTKELEEKLQTSSTLSEEVFSDEGKALEGELKVLKSELSEVKTELAKKDLLISHPILKEKWQEFEEFRADPDNKGMNLRTAAKAYLVENGLLDTPRKGLEKPTGGDRVPLTSGMTSDDVKTLRETNFKKYQELLLKGQLKIEK